MPFISIDLWQIIFTLGNTLILYLIVKKLLFKPVVNMMQARTDEVAKTYEDAESAKQEALAAKEEYTSRIQHAKEEAQSIMKEAVSKANDRSEEIVTGAKEQAAHLMERAQSEIERDKQKAVNEVKDEISDLAMQIAAKVVEHEVDEKDHEKLIESFISSAGDESWLKQ